MRTSCAASPTLKAAAREQSLEERGADPASGGKASIAHSGCPLQRFGGFLGGVSDPLYQSYRLLRGATTPTRSSAQA